MASLPDMPAPALLDLPLTCPDCRVLLDGRGTSARSCPACGGTWELAGGKWWFGGGG